MKINNCFSDWGNIIKEIGIANYADYYTPYATYKSIEILLQKLETETSTLNECFHFNHLKSNSDKNKLPVTNDKTVSVTIENQMIKSDITVKMLGITIDSKLNFQEHVRKVCQRTSQKIHALGRISTYTGQRQT